MEPILNVLGHGFFLYPVAFCGILALAIAAERFFYLFFQAALAPEPFFAEIQRRVLGGRIDGAIAYCGSAPRSPLASVVRSALQTAGADREDLTLAIDQATADQLPKLQTRLGYLATIANVVTMFGLLGTIFGLIVSFEAVSNANPEEKQTLLAQGIALAMHTTAAGIGVAIPTLAVYSVLAARANRMLDDIDRYGLRIVQLLVAHQRGAAAPAPDRQVASGE